MLFLARPVAVFRTVGLGTVLASSLFLAGCGGGDKSAPEPGSKPAPSAAAAPAARPMGDSDLLTGVPVGAGATNSAADLAWNTLLMAMRPPQPPSEWQTNTPSKEVQAEFRKKVGESAA